MNLDNPRIKTGLHLGFFLLFISLAILHQSNIVKFDAISLALIVIGFLPFLLPYLNKNFKSIEIFGVKAELLDKIEKQKDKIEQNEIKLDEQQKIINELVKYSMSASIFHHLCGIALLKVYVYRDNEYFRREMYFLRDNGFIMPKALGFVDFNSGINNSNLVENVTLTPIGKTCIRLRKDEVPVEMIKDVENLRIDPGNL